MPQWVQVSERHVSSSNVIMPVVLPPWDGPLPDSDLVGGGNSPARLRNRYGDRLKGSLDASLKQNHLRNRNPPRDLVGSFL